MKVASVETKAKTGDSGATTVAAVEQTGQTWEPELVEVKSAH